MSDKDDRGQAPEDVIEGIADGMAAAYDPEGEEAGRKKGGKTGGKTKAPVKKLAPDRNTMADKFWSRRRDQQLHDMARTHLLDMLELGGLTVKGGKDALAFRDELKALIEKRFTKAKETK